MVCALKRIAVEVHNVAVLDHDLMWISSLSGPDYTTCRNTPCVPQIQDCFSCAYNDLQLQLQLIRLLNTVVSELILCVQSPIKYYSPSDEVGAVNAVAVKSQGNLCSPQVRGQQWHWGRVVWRGCCACARTKRLTSACTWMDGSILWASWTREGLPAQGNQPAAYPASSLHVLSKLTYEILLALHTSPLSQPTHQHTHTRTPIHTYVHHIWHQCLPRH